jgi:hypothetical protein
MDAEFCDMCDMRVSVDRFSDDAGVYHYECFTEWLHAEASKYRRDVVSQDDYSGYDRDDYKHPERVERAIDFADAAR